MHEQLQMIPPFFTLPTELHGEIASYLDLGTLFQLLRTCRRANTLYEHKHTQRAAFRLWVCIQTRRPMFFPLPSETWSSYYSFNCYLALKKEWPSMDRTENFSICSAMSRREISENWFSIIASIQRKVKCSRKLRFKIPHSEFAPELAEMKLFVRKRFFQSTKVIPRQSLENFSREKIESMLRAIGSWDVVEDIFIVLLWAIGFRGALHNRRTEQRRTGTAAMLARRTAELGPPKSKILLESPVGALSPNELRFLRMFREARLNPDSTNLLWRDELLFDAFNPARSVDTEADNTGGNLEHQYRVIKFLLKTFGAQSTTGKPPASRKPDASTLGLLDCFAKRSSLPGETLVDDQREKMYKPVLDLLAQHGLELQDVSIESLKLLPISSEDIDAVILGIIATVGLHIVGIEDEEQSQPFYHQFCRISTCADWEHQVVRTLVQQGANVNAQNNDGDTPLLVLMTELARQTVGNQSFKRRHREAIAETMRQKDYLYSDKIRHLMHLGADPFLVNNAGHTAIGIAMIIGYPHLITDFILLDHQRQSRYGPTLTPSEIHTKWESDDTAFWTSIAYPGASPRRILEQQVIQVPQRVEENEYNCHEWDVLVESDDMWSDTYKFDRGWNLYDGYFHWEAATRFYVP